LKVVHCHVTNPGNNSKKNKQENKMLPEIICTSLFLISLASWLIHVWNRCLCR
jgi:hypothetical protein